MRHLKPLPIACHQVQLQKNLKTRLLKNVDFGPKNTPVLDVVIIYLKNTEQPL